MEGWEWDPTLYGGSAPYYLSGRLPYAPRLAQAFVEALALDGTGRLLDVGTGPGVIAMDLALSSSRSSASTRMHREGGSASPCLRVRASYPAIGSLAHRTLLEADRRDPAADLARTRA